jgi:hypothetical protein
LKLFKVEASVDAKPNIDEFYVHVKASLVDYGVSQLGDNKVETSTLFSTKDTWKVIDDMINWVR